MNRIAIPTILTATVLVAGIFAFMPVEQASTVHTTIQDTQLAIIIENTDDAGNNAGTRNAAAETITVDCDRDFTLMSMLLRATGNNGADDLDINFITIDGNRVNLDVNLEVDGGAEVWEGDILAQMNGVSTEDASLPGGPISAIGAGANDIQFTTAGAVQATLAEPLRWTAGILTDSGATCTVTGS